MVKPATASLDRVFAESVFHDTNFASVKIHVFSSVSNQYMAWHSFSFPVPAIPIHDWFAIFWPTILVPNHNPPVSPALLVLPVQYTFSDLFCQNQHLLCASLPSSYFDVDILFAVSHTLNSVTFPMCAIFFGQSACLCSNNITHHRFRWRPCWKPGWLWEGDKIVDCLFDGVFFHEIGHRIPQ